MYDFYSLYIACSKVVRIVKNQKHILIHLVSVSLFSFLLCLHPSTSIQQTRIDINSIINRCFFNSLFVRFSPLWITHSGKRNVSVYQHTYTHTHICITITLYVYIPKCVREYNKMIEWYMEIISNKISVNNKQKMVKNGFVHKINNHQKLV